MPSPRVPNEDDYLSANSCRDEEEGMALETYLMSMEKFDNHTNDELKPKTLYELAWVFPAFHSVEGSWLFAYNLVLKHFEIRYLHSSLRKDQFSISDTQWKLYSPSPEQGYGLMI